jgi:hypothetical protein
MRPFTRRQWLVAAAAAAAAVAGGCRTPKRPDTPAAQIPPSAQQGPIPGHHFYITVFGSQSVPKVPRYTHTWATVAHAVEGPNCDFEYHTISWMPANLKIRPFSRHPEPGVNLDLHTTVKVMLDNRERVAMWGPYECRPRLYERLLVQKQFMESGRVGYQCIDAWGEAAREGNACDCIHAITDADPEFDRRNYPLRRYGQAASEYLVEQIWTRDALLSPGQTHEWVAERMGLNGYPIERKVYRG